MARKALKELADKLYPEPIRQVEKKIEQDFTPSLPIETMFLNALNSTIKKLSSKPNHSSKTYKPSNLNCLRSMYYGVVGMGVGEYLEEILPDMVGIGESGTARHEHLQSYITKMKEVGFNWEFIAVPDFIKEFGLNHLTVKENKYSSDYETNLMNNRYNLSFMTDGIVKFNNQYFILEIKTETSKKFYERQSVDENHLNQAIAYSLSFGIDKVIFIYENRDTCAKKSYLLEITEDDKKYLIDKINECNEYADKKQLPPKITDKKNCKYCKYKKFCDLNKNIDE